MSAAVTLHDYHGVRDPTMKATQDLCPAIVPIGGEKMHTQPWSATLKQKRFSFFRPSSSGKSLVSHSQRSHLAGCSRGWKVGSLQFFPCYLRLISVPWTLIKHRPSAGIEKPKSSEMNDDSRARWDVAAPTTSMICTDLRLLHLM